MLSRRHKIIASSLIAIILIGGAFTLKFLQRPVAQPTLPTPGKYESAHEHGSLLMFIRGEAIDFSQERYQSQSDLVHFEDADGITFHKHATGITLPYFLGTLGIQLTEDCIQFEGVPYCTDNDEELGIFINEQKLSLHELMRRELSSHDKILITYGSETSVDIALRLNSIPATTEKQ